MPCNSSLKKTVLAPFASEAGWNDWEIRNPDQPTQQTRLRCIQEAYAGDLLPLRLVRDVIGLQFGRIMTREIGINQERALRNINLESSQHTSRKEHDNTVLGHSRICWGPRY
jgi:hypothetical protein